MEIFELRPDEIEEIRASVVLPAWLSAYSHIFPAENIRMLFRGEASFGSGYADGREPSFGSYKAVESGQPIGILNLGSFPGDHSEGEVRGLYVHPFFQGKGIGRSLWEFSEIQFSRRRLRAVNVWTLSEARSCHFYRAMGCTEIQSGRNWLDDTFASATRFRKRLQ